MTLMLDAYTEPENATMRAAIDDLCSPRDSIGWASTGVYCYWSIPEHAILHIGRAVDLAERFGQHNGLIPCPSNSCKRERIDEYFETHETIGYSMIVQSPLAQAKSHRAVRHLGGDPISISDFQELGEHGRDFSVEVEGAMIAAFRQVGNQLPPWNDIGGAGLSGGVTKATILTLELLRGARDDAYCARRTIRQLSADPTAMYYEEFLHPMRMVAMFAGQKLSRVFQDWPDADDRKARILSENYLRLSALTEIPVL